MYDPIAVGNSIYVTVTGIVTSAADVTIQNTASASPIGLQDPTSSNNSKSVSVDIAGYAPLEYVYLPMIFQNPLLLYSENFSNSRSGWPISSQTAICDRRYLDGEYFMKAFQYKRCFSYAPGDAEYRNGEFQVTAHTSQGSGDFAYGIYINGSGDQNYYLFAVRPDDNCGWTFIRRQGGTNTFTKHEIDCSNIKTGNGKNVLTLKHLGGGKITAYINNILVYTYQDNNPLTGIGTGLYLQGDTQEINPVSAMFDNFKVYR